MFNLYFQRANGELRFIQKVDKEEILSAINKEVERLNPNYKIYYVRSWGDDNRITYDVGSHTEFFIAEKVI